MTLLKTFFPDINISPATIIFLIALMALIALGATAYAVLLAYTVVSDLRSRGDRWVERVFGLEMFTLANAPAFADQARRRKGMVTEERAGQQLRSTVPSGWRVDLKVMRKRGGDFDAVIRGPARQHYVVEIKSHAGPPREGDDGLLYIGRDERDKILQQVLDQERESGAVPIVWQPLADYRTTTIQGVTFISGNSAAHLWTLITQATPQA